MLRFLKQCGWVAMLALGATSASAFTLGGPINEPYQVPTIGYNLPGDINAPKNLGEEYRWNKPTIYYAFDQNFLDYFGSNGVFAVSQAFEVFNALTNVSQYSADLSEFPLESRRFNFQAQALTLHDLKSGTMNLIIEQLGLAESQRYTWTLRNRIHLDNTPACPDGMQYLVIKRNYEIYPTAPDQYQESSYVNGTLFSYQIFEACTGVTPLADAEEFPVDPLADTYTPVSEIFGQVGYGVFYNGLTRDDVGGLRYLYRTNNMNVENAGIGTVTAVTNLNVNQLLITSNLATLIYQSLTNDAAALTALYPGLVVTDTTTAFTNVVTTNLVAYYTNYPWSPAGSPPTLVVATSYSTNVATRYYHNFANVVTNSYYTNGILRIQTTTVDQCQLAPPGLVCTNVTFTTAATNLITGDYYFLPTNSDCGVMIVSTQFTTVLTITNSILAATNTSGSTTNQGGSTNVITRTYTQDAISYFTNHFYVYHPVPCASNALSIRQGVEKVRFVRRDFDSLIGQYYEPITDEYTANVITNSTLYRQTVRRLVAQPDIRISADNLTSGPAEDPWVNPWAERNINFNEDNVLVTATGTLAGPGTIEPSVWFTFNKVGQVFVNQALNFLDEVGAVKLQTWASYDGTTNAPVVYPNGTSIWNVENQVLIQISPPTLPDGRAGVAYTNVFGGFTVNGGQSPYVWSLAPGSPGLPPGLALAPVVGNSSACRIIGTPAMVGTFDFVLRLNEAGGRYVDRNYSITVNP